MAITGHLIEFSLPEIFQFLEQGQKTGLLTISPLPEPADTKSPRTHYIWFQQGCIVAAANRSDHRGLLTIISQRGWVGDRALSRLMQSCPVNSPAGLCLKTQGLLQADQLKLLFYVQVMQQVCALFTLEDGWFHFDTSQKAPVAELTGLSAPAVDVTLAGLRALKNWTTLADKLPSPTSGLVTTITGKPTLKLNQTEWQVWEFTDGHTSIQEIARHLQLSVEKVQQIAFRLIVVNLVEEMPIIVTQEADTNGTFDPFAEGGSKDENQLSHSFLQNLMGFLKGQT